MLNYIWLALVLLAVLIGGVEGKLDLVTKDALDRASFAIDSVPAIFAITSDPYIVYTSNIFAILGLRALFFALAAMVHRFQYLKYALALTLVFIGSKIFLGDLFPGGKFPATWSLAITMGLTGGGILYSLWKTRTPAVTKPGRDQADKLPEVR